MVHFHKNKYGRELLIDCGRMEDKNSQFIINHNPFVVDFHEIFMITSGKGSFRLDEQSVEFGPGTVMFMPPRKTRQWTRLEGDVKGYVLIFEEEFIADYFRDTLFLYRFHFFYDLNSPFFLHLDRKEMADMEHSLSQIQLELTSLQSDSDHLLRSILYFVLIRFNRMYQEQFQVAGQFFDNTLALRFRKMLSNKIKTHQKVGEYADLLQVSKSHLNKILKTAIGMSTSELIKERLLSEVKRELLFTDKTISEIGFDFQFSDPSNFIRFFRELSKETPREYRLRHQKPSGE
ncbi:MAG: AraC family transcriptional regulator [Bacteroidota bacterium]